MGKRGKRIDFRSMVGRLTGVSTAWGGISWQPGTSEREVANRVITYLEDRRVLYNPYDVEVTTHVITSILEIRNHLTNEMDSLDRSAQLTEHLAAMRAACRKFLTSIEPFKNDLPMTTHSLPNWVFYMALGELRGVFGIHIAQIAVKYQIDVEADLATIMPDADETDSNNL